MTASYNCGADDCCDGTDYPECMACDTCDLADALRYKQQPETD